MLNMRWTRAICMAASGWSPHAPSAASRLVVVMPAHMVGRCQSFRRRRRKFLHYYHQPTRSLHCAPFRIAIPSNPQKGFLSFAIFKNPMSEFRIQLMAQREWKSTKPNPMKNTNVWGYLYLRLIKWVGRQPTKTKQRATNFLNYKITLEIVWSQSDWLVNLAYVLFFADLTKKTLTIFYSYQRNKKYDM